MRNIMKDKMVREWENRRAPRCQAMKIRVIFGLCAVLAANCISVRAADNPAQAAARLVLEQKLRQPDAWEPQALTLVTLSSSVVVAQPPVKSKAQTTGTVFKKTVTPQTTLASTGPVAAPATVASVIASPETLYLLLSLLIISFMVMSFLLVKFLRQDSRSYGSHQASTGSRT